MMKKVLYVLLTLLVLTGVYLMGFSMYHSGELEYMETPSAETGN